MAAFVLTSEYLALNAVDYTTKIKSCTLQLEAEPVDSTAMGGSGWKSNLAGLKSGTLDITFNDDYAASTVDDLLWALFGTTTTFEVRPTNAAVSATNPKYTGSLVLTQHQLGGSVGELAAKQISVPVTGAVARATS